MSKSPILQARLNAMAKAKEPSAPIINVVLPNNPFGIYQHAPNGPNPALAPAHPIAPASRHLISAINQGAKIDLATFCSVYALPDSIHNRLRENAISGTHAFAHLTSEDLKEMGFKLGEIINLNQAIREWGT